MLEGTRMRPEESAIEKESSSLVITREPGTLDRLREYKIMLDNVVAGVLREGETKALVLTPGRHTIAVKIDWLGSPVEEFEVRAGETVQFKCRSGSFGPARAFFRRNRYVVVAPSESAFPPQRSVSQEIGIRLLVIFISAACLIFGFLPVAGAIGVKPKVSGFVVAGGVLVATLFSLLAQLPPLRK